MTLYKVLEIYDIWRVKREQEAKDILRQAAVSGEHVGLDP